MKTYRRYPRFAAINWTQINRARINRALSLVSSMLLGLASAVAPAASPEIGRAHV